MSVSKLVHISDICSTLKTWNMQLWGVRKRCLAGLPSKCPNYSALLLKSILVCYREDEITMACLLPIDRSFVNEVLCLLDCFTLLWCPERVKPLLVCHQKRALVRCLFHIIVPTRTVLSWLDIFLSKTIPETRVDVKQGQCSTHLFGLSWNRLSCVKRVYLLAYSITKITVVQ